VQISPFCEPLQEGMMLLMYEKRSELDGKDDSETDGRRGASFAALSTFSLPEMPA